MNNLTSKNDVERYADLCLSNSKIDPQLYVDNKVNRGLRDLNGKGVLTGLTEISDVVSKKIVDGEEVPCEGKLYYRGYNVEDLVAGFMTDDRFGFEEIIYLLLFGKLPYYEELEDFKELLYSFGFGRRFRLSRRPIIS